jgi:hypothetical protein
VTQISIENRVYLDIPRHSIDISNGVLGLSWQGEKRSGQLALNGSRRADMGIKATVVLLVGFALASGCVASGASRYRPCHELRTDMSVSNDEYEFHCPTRYRE